MVWGVYYNLPLQPPTRLRKAAGQGPRPGKVPTTSREFRRRILEAGLVIEMGGSGHYKVMTPEGQYLYAFPASPSDHRWLMNATRDMARKGYDLTR